MEEPRRRSGAVTVLLALMVLAQLGILNEIRYQGCLDNQVDFMVAGAPNDLDCSRIPLL